MEILSAIATYFSGPLGKVELFASIFSLICVWLAAKQNIWTWFWGSLGVIGFGYLFSRPEIALYFDAILQLAFYLPIQIVGYFMWKKHGAGSTDFIKSMNWKWWVAIIPFIAIATYFSAGILIAVGGSFPVLDSIIVWASVIAQILLAKHMWQSWVLWVGVDFIAIYVYAMKGLLVTAGLYGIFLVLASYGLLTWYKQWSKQNAV